MVESVAVGVRVRPFNEREKNLKADLCISMHGPRTTLTYKGKENVFTFDESFWSHDGFEEVDGVMLPVAGSKYADQQTVFEAFGRRVLNNAWDGFHCCLFAYGQTGAGKSYSMVGMGKNKGIVPISCEEIFHRIDANEHLHRSFEITASMIEIYNETVQDLFILPQDRPTGGLPIHESKMLGVYVDGVRKTPVQSYAAIEKVINTATEHRTIGNTLMNATSSRAHTVLTIEFKQVEQIEGKENVKLSMINLVDLAGSEKSATTGAAGERLKEGCAINKSLSALGNVIEKLAKKSTGKKKDQDVRVPYRDSKLTRLLQNALGGSSKTIMICALSPASSNAEETLSTLRYADRAKQIKNNATVNEDPQGKLLREMKEENEKLKEMMTALSGGGTVDLVSMQARMQELAKAEQAYQEMQRSFSEKVKEASEMESAMREKARKRGWTQGMQRQSAHMANLNEDVQLCGKLMYHFENGVTTIGNPDAEDDSDDDADKDEDDDDADDVNHHRRGSLFSSSSSISGGSSSSSSSSSSSPSGRSSDSDGEAQPDVVLSGEDIRRRQATVTKTSGVCYLNSSGRAAESTFVNGVSVSELLSRQRTGREEDTQQPRRREEDEEGEGIPLEHCDRVVFGIRVHLIFVFIDPQKRDVHPILAGKVTYAMARKELRERFMVRMRGLGIFLGKAQTGECSCSEHEEERGRQQSAHIPCATCRRELEGRDREIQQLRGELEAVRGELASLKGVAGESSAQLSPKGLGVGVSLLMRETFEDAIGALDLLQMRLTSTKAGQRLGREDHDVTALYSF